MEKLDVNKSDYSLSIRVSPDGFSLSILDHVGALLVSRDIPAALSSMKKAEIVAVFEEKNGINPADYNDVHLVVESDLYVFVPAPIFKPQNIDDYFYFQHEKDNRRIVLFNRISNCDAVNIFSIPVELNEALNELFQDTVVTHQLSDFLSERIKTKEDCIHVLLRPKILDVVVFNSGTLSLINSFAYRTKEDFAYFVLSIFEQLNLDTEKVAVKLYQRNDSTEFKELILMYVKNCELILQ